MCRAVIIHGMDCAAIPGQVQVFIGHSLLFASLLTVD